MIHTDGKDARQSERRDPVDRSDDSDRSDGAERPDQVDRSDRSDESDRSERLEGPDERDRFVRLGLVLLLGIQLVLLWPFRQYVTDDTYIHLQFARSVAAGQGFTFDGVEPVYGFTSPLWVLLLAAGDRLGFEGLLTARLLGLLFTFGSVAAVYGIAQVWIRDRTTRWVATVAWAVDAWLLRWTFSGMETSLAVCLVAGGFLLHARARRDGTSSAPTMALFALSALARPECLALCFLAGLDVLLPAGRRLRSRSRLFLEATIPPLVLLLPWFLYAEDVFGRLLPTSVASKSPAFAGSLLTVLHTLVREATLVGATRGVELLLLGAVVTALLIRVARRTLSPTGLRAGFVRYRLVVAWVLVFSFGYALRETVLVSRYVLLVTPVIALLGFAGAAWFPRRVALPAVLVAGVLAVSLNLGVLYARSLPHTRQFTDGLHSSIGEIAVWLRENTPEETTIAAPDIGLLGYLSERRIIDLSGLVTPDLLPLFEGRQIEDFLSEMGFSDRYRPDYLIDRANEVARLPLVGPHGERLEVVLVREIGPLGIARPGPYYYTLYRLDWSGVPGGTGIEPSRTDS